MVFVVPALVPVFERNIRVCIRACIRTCISIVHFDRTFRSYRAWIGDHYERVIIWKEILALRARTLRSNITLEHHVPPPPLFFNRSISSCACLSFSSVSFNLFNVSGGITTSFSFFSRLSLMSSTFLFNFSITLRAVSSCSFSTLVSCWLETTPSFPEKTSLVSSLILACPSKYLESYDSFDLPYSAFFPWLSEVTIEDYFEYSPKSPVRLVYAEGYTLWGCMVLRNWASSVRTCCHVYVVVELLHIRQNSFSRTYLLVKKWVLSIFESETLKRTFFDLPPHNWIFNSFSKFFTYLCSSAKRELSFRHNRVYIPA